MGVLIAIGVILLLFGGVILLLFPDKPGGTISLAGLNVNSTGAGLPVMVLGAGLIVLAVLKQPPDGPKNTLPSPSPAAASPGASPRPAPSPSPSSVTSPAPDPGGTRIVTAGPRSSRSGPLTLTVEHIDELDRSMEVNLKAANTGSRSLTLPVFRTFFLRETDSGKTYEVNPAAGTWPQDVPPGATVSGTIVITEPLGPNAKTLDVGFSHVFGSFEVDNITVRAVPLAGR